MEILISVLVILLVFFVLYVMWLYNQLIHVQVNRDNALHDIAHDLDKLFIELTTHTSFKKTTKKAGDARVNATTSDEKVAAFNLLVDHIDTIATDTTTQTYIDNTTLGRRYYNHATKRFNANISTFPTKALAYIL